MCHDFVSLLFKYVRMVFHLGKNRYILFSALAGIVIWFLTFTILVSFTEISIFFNKLICVLTVLTFWLIRWYKGISQYIHDIKYETRIITRLRAVLKYGMNEVFHFIVLISVLLIIMIFIERFI
jgi:hypothetical protein